MKITLQDRLSKYNEDIGDYFFMPPSLDFSVEMLLEAPETAPPSLIAPVFGWVCVAKVLRCLRHPIASRSSFQGGDCVGHELG